MKLKLCNVRDGRYAIGRDDNSISIEISRSDIDSALINYEAENRSFQGDLSSINADLSNLPLEEAARINKRYHVSRIATIIREKLYLDPILTIKGINPAEDYLDGGHRVIAARYLGLQEIDAIEISKALTEDEKTALWKKVTESNGNFQQALEKLAIEYSII